MDFNSSKYPLSRPGYNLTPEQYDKIIELVRSGRKEEAQVYILDVIEENEKR